MECLIIALFTFTGLAAWRRFRELTDLHAERQDSE